jgi:alkylation response protein AidB-like acyl-CoA dehydrogenase
VDVTVPEHIRPLRDRVLRFVEDRIYPVEGILERGIDHDVEARATMQRLMAEAKAEDLWALGHPEHLGGGGLPFMDYVFINEVVGMSREALWIFGTHSLQDSLMLDRYASPRWREEYLKPLVAGEIIQSYAMTEPDVASSDPTQLRTRAVLDGDAWVINGRKWFTSHASRARYLTVMCRTEDDSVEPHLAFSQLIVPTDTPGFRIERRIPVMGAETGDHCEVTFTDCRVPADSLLGPRGQGFQIAQDRLGPGRIFHCMRWLGQAQRAFDLMCARAVSRVAFGGPLADKQFVQEWVYASATEITSYRLFVLDVARRIDEGDTPRAEISMIKVAGAAMLHNVIDRAVQVHGAMGVSGDTPLERMYRAARSARILDGPDEVHKQRVARLMLKPYRAALRAPIE